MAWVRFPDGSRKKVEQADRDDAESDLDELPADREEGCDAQLLQRWMAEPLSLGRCR